ncbi:hypothetical protein Gotur_006904 [Gossypium turneri]
MVMEMESCQMEAGPSGAHRLEKLDGCVKGFINGLNGSKSVEFLSKEPDNASRGLGLEDDFEVPIEVTKMENGDAGMKLMSGRLIGEEPSNQIVIVEHGGVDVPTVGELSTKK